MTLDPDAVITGRAAAALTWWPELQAPVLDVACRGRRDDRPGFRWHQEAVAPDHLVEVEGIRLTTPALTVLDLLPSLGGTPIDEALRRRAASLEDLSRTLNELPHRVGNQQRRWLLEDSRDEPWSEAERRLHRTMRGLSLRYAFRTNFPVRLADGTRRLLDVALPDLLLAFEVDGWEFHGSRASFVSDRVSDAELGVLGWERHRFDATAVFDDEEWVARTIQGIVTAREALFLGRPLGGVSAGHC